MPKFREKYREFCSPGPPSATIGSESSAKFNGLRRNSLRIGTGNLFRPSRELIRAIRELNRLIRESRAGRDFTATLNRVSDQLAHDEQGAEGDKLHLSGGDPLAHQAAQT